MTMLRNEVVGEQLCQQWKHVTVEMITSSAISLSVNKTEVQQMRRRLSSTCREYLPIRDT